MKLCFLRGLWHLIIKVLTTDAALALTTDVAFWFAFPLWTCGGLWTCCNLNHIVQHLDGKIGPCSSCQQVQIETEVRVWLVRYEALFFWHILFNLMIVGDIYLATNIFSQEKVAVKLERSNSECPQLDSESKVYRILAGGIGIPSLHWFGRESNYYAMVIDRLGPSLQDLLNQCSGRFSLKTVLLLARQLVRDSIVLNWLDITLI